MTMPAKPLAPPPVVPAYGMTAANEPIILYSGKLTVRSNGKTADASGTLRWLWLPSPQVRYDLTSSEPDLSLWAMNGEIEVEINDTPESDGATSSVASDEDTSLRASGRFGNITRGLAQDMKHVTFQVANMPRLHGAFVTANGNNWNGRISLSSATWMVTLDTRSDRDEVFQQLDDDGGYAPTYAGRLERHDGGEITPTEVAEVFHALRSCLSFAFGRHITPSLAAGYNAGGDVVWRDWQVFGIDPWSNAHHIIDITGQGDLRELFSCFMKLWDDSFMRDQLSRAVHYYLASNDPQPIELATATAQSGLELLAWEVLVEEKSLYSPGDFTRKQAHEKMAELLATYGVDSAFPPRFTHLSTSAGLLQSPCATGAEMLARMRNGVTHPSRKKPKFDQNTWIEAWQLMRRYLILAILGRIDFQGSICDPIDPNKNVGHKVAVPWVQPATTKS